eukprot:NODE_4705_length_752_cov_23.041600_g4545_i0.p1 GENE.NODE_4705_length_752_cov_23.041600_g4545_i0~~NODE_4705_length_752_cov_23.041600_g4545_i0.p1  ORF type:complete len:210 (-),score=46.84 NODE_4705_length_752_cov_23.041600_g4545_i0:67-696(-)
MLILALHTIPTVTAVIPLFVLTLQDHQKRNLIPSEFKLRQLFPTSGVTSVSVWDAPAIGPLQAWVEETIQDCEHQFFTAQEEFTYGVAMELARVRSADALSMTATELSTKATEQLTEFNQRYHLSEKANQASQALTTTATELSSKAAAQYSELDQQFQLTERATAGLELVGNSTKATVGWLQRMMGNEEAPPTAPAEADRNPESAKDLF